MIENMRLDEKTVKNALTKLGIEELLAILETAEEGFIESIIVEEIKQQALEVGVCPECAANYEYTELAIVFSHGKVEAICDCCESRFTIAEKEKESDV